MSVRRPPFGKADRYDRRQIERESARHGLTDPHQGSTHQKLKMNFAKRRKIKQTGMATAMRIAGLEQEGDHHRVC